MSKILLLRVLLGIIASFLLPSICTAELVAWWKLDETAGTATVVDARGQFSMAVTGEVAFGENEVVTGMPGTSLHFPSHPMLIARPQFDAALSTQEFTICCWVKYDTVPVSLSYNQETFVMTPTSDLFHGVQLRFITNNGGVFSPVYGVGNAFHLLDGTTNVQAGTWYHVAVSFKSTFGNSGTIRLCVNGVQDAAANDVFMPGTAGSFRLGHRYDYPNTLETFKGRLDDVQVYDHALTSADLLYLYQNPGEAILLGLDDPDLAGVPARLDFPLIEAGSVTTTELNIGNGAIQQQLTLQPSIISGDMQRFSIVQSTPDSIAPGSSAPLIMQFDASDSQFSGSTSAVLQIESNDPSDPVTTTVLYGSVYSLVSANPAHFIEDVRSGKAVKVVVMGTSLSNEDNNWHWQLQNWLKLMSPDPDQVSVVSVGVGASSSDNVTPQRSGIQNQLPRALAQNPDVLFIEFSINDSHTPYNISLQQSRTNHETIFAGLKAQNPNLEIVMVTMNSIEGTPTGTRPDLLDYNQLYRDMAALNGYPLVDLYPAWQNFQNTDHDLWQLVVPDDIHPNDLGEALITVPGIRRALDSKVGFINGSFEQAEVASWRYRAHGQNMGLWRVTNTSSSGNAVIHWNQESVDPAVKASDGKQLLTLQSDNHLAAIHQTFDTDPGSKYRVTFDLSAIIGKLNGTPQAQTLVLNLSAADNEQQFSIAVPAQDALAMVPYQTHTFDFSAAESSTTLSFENQVLYTGHSNWGLSIDNIRVEQFPAEQEANAKYFFLYSGSDKSYSKVVSRWK